jgi:hypothetical protein
MSKISEEQARDQLETLLMLGEDAAAFEEVRGYGSVEPGSPPSSVPSDGRSKAPI